MAFCNTSQFIAKRLIKSKNITDCNQVERIFKSSAFLAWDNIDLFSEQDITDSGLVPSTSRVRVRGLVSRKPKLNRSSNPVILDSDYNCDNNSMDNTLVLLTVSGEKTPLDQQTAMSFRRNSDNLVYSDSSDRTNYTTNIEKLFPSPGVIVKDIYEIFGANKPTRERDSAVINYIKLLFQKLKKLYFFKWNPLHLIAYFYSLSQELSKTL